LRESESVRGRERKIERGVRVRERVCESVKGRVRET
jgi:hypothetical protein